MYASIQCISLDSPSFLSKVNVYPCSFSGIIVKQGKSKATHCLFVWFAYIRFLPSSFSLSRTSMTHFTPIQASIGRARVLNTQTTTIQYTRYCVAIAHLAPLVQKYVVRVCVYHPCGSLLCSLIIKNPCNFKSYYHKFHPSSLIWCERAQIYTRYILAAAAQRLGMEKREILV